MQMKDKWVQGVYVHVCMYMCVHTIEHKSFLQAEYDELITTDFWT